VVNNLKETDVYTLKSMILGNHFNQIESIAHTAKGSKGIMGLFGRSTTNLFLEDGVYGGWSRDAPNEVENLSKPKVNSYGNHPIYMGMDQDGQWFGVYTNLVAAQDWYIKNIETGDVQVKTIAAGGLGDIYIMLGSNPNKVTKLYHSIIGKPVLTP
jgi:lysosomal alpha-glucosidase